MLRSLIIKELKSILKIFSKMCIMLNNFYIFADKSNQRSGLNCSTLYVSLAALTGLFSGTTFLIKN